MRFGDVFADEGHQNFHPNAVQPLGVVLNREDPPPAMFISRIFPKWLYPLLEEMVVGIVGQFTGIENIVKNRPELFHVANG